MLTHGLLCLFVYVRLSGTFCVVFFSYFLVDNYLQPNVLI